MAAGWDETQTWAWGDEAIAYTDAGGAGAGTAVFVHAPEVGGGREEWRPLAEPLEGRVLALDLPGFGDGPVTPRRYTADEMVELLVAFLDGPAGAPADVVARGHAAAYAVKAALEAPDAVRTLTLINPHGIQPREPHEEVIELLTGPGGRQLYEAEVAAPGVIAEWLASEVYADPARPSDEEVAATVARARRQNAEWPIASLLAGDLALDVRREWCDVRTPALVLWGHLCEDPPLDDAERWLLPLRPDAPFMVIDGEPVGFQKADVIYKSVLHTRGRPHGEAPEAVRAALLARWELETGEGDESEGA